MSEYVRETLCTSCIHREVCKYKENYLENYLKVREAAFNTRVNEFSIEVNCKYYENWKAEWYI